MSCAGVADTGAPLTEADFLALPPDPAPAELWDGNLLVRPRDTARHDRIRAALLAALRAGRADLAVRGDARLRLRPDRIVAPDLVVTGAAAAHTPVLDAADVRLVGEVVSGPSAAVDRVLKMHGYAAAGIGWYLLVDQETCTLHGYALAGGAYVERSTMRLAHVTGHDFTGA